MRTIISKHQKIKSICRVMNNYPQAFEEKAKALEMKNGFNQQSEGLSELISKLLRPASTIYRPKQDSQQKLRVAVSENIGMGILLATHLENMPLLDLLKVYKLRINNVSAYKLFEMAGHVAEELQKYSETGIEYGLSEDKLTTFTNQIADFGEILNSTGSKLTNRKSDWNALNKQVLLCSKTIRLQLDPFMEFNEKDFPALFKEYMLVRGSRKRRKRIVINESSSGDISGVVTDSLNGLPVANVTLNLLEHETAYLTDADGYYLIDELAAASYTVSCHATGYEVPQQVTVELAADESLFINFSLVPVANPLNK